MALSGRQTRELVLGVFGAMLCAYTGYFLCHTWKTLDRAAVGLLVCGVGAVYAGAWLMGTAGKARGSAAGSGAGSPAETNGRASGRAGGPGAGPMGTDGKASGRTGGRGAWWRAPLGELRGVGCVVTACGLALFATMVVAAKAPTVRAGASLTVNALWPVPVWLAAWLSVRFDRFFATRFVFGLLAMGAALVVGAAGPPLAADFVGDVSQVGPALIAYIALVGALRPTRGGGAPRFLFSTVLGACVVGVLGLGVAALFRPHGLLAAFFCVWLLVYLVQYGRHALRKCSSDRVELFVEHAWIGAGFLAGALLTVRLPAGRASLAELAWAVIAGGGSMVLMRAWPFVRRSTAARRS